MKLLLLLSAFFYHVHAQGEIVRTCITGERNFVCSFGKFICKIENGPYTCPKLCGLCTIPKTKAKAVFAKLDKCPQKRPSKATPVYCWEATWNNNNTYEAKTVVFFYPVNQTVNGEKKIVGYSGIMPSDKSGSIFAVGDIEGGKYTVAFGINSKFTDDKRVEFKGKALKIPTFPGLFQAVPAVKSTGQVSARSVEPESNENTGTKKFDKRDVMMEGYTVYVQPIVDARFQNGTPGIDPMVHTMALVEYAAEAFKDPSLKVQIFVKCREPVLYNKTATGNDKGYRALTSGATAYDFSQHYKYDEQNATVYLFLSITPFQEIDDSFKMVYARAGGSCQGHDQRVAIVEYFEAFEAAAAAVTKGIAAVLGVNFDYLNVSFAEAIPRFSKGGDPCTGVSGFMDETFASTHWTRCSNEDLEEAVKNDELNCLRNEDCYDVAHGCKRLTDAECSYDMSYDNCRKTCGYCTPKNMTKCEDTNAVCMLGFLDPNLVHKYVCETHPGFCRKTCQLC